MACITKRRGRYVIDCYDQNGKRYRKSLWQGITKQRAREILREVEEKIESKTFTQEKKIPLFSDVANTWLEYKETRLRSTTWGVYKIHVRIHYTELLAMKIDRITTPVIEKWITKRQADGMNISTLRKLLVSLNQIFTYAVRHKYITSNPVRDAERPRKTVDYETEEKIKILTSEGIRNLLNATKDPKYKTLFLTAIMTGAREGEILGLKWSDIEFNKKQIFIKRSFNHGQFFAPKTKQSIRAIDIAPTLLQALASWKLASTPNEHDLVFANEAGQPLNYSNMVNRHFFKALKDANIEKIRFHDLRHTYASLLLAQGENIKYIQTQLGHSSPIVTLNVYSHLMKKENQEAVCRLENAIFQESGHNLVTKTKEGLTVNG